MMPSGTDTEPSGKFAISRSQIAVLGFVLILLGAFLSGRQLGWLGGFRNESVAIPSGAPYAEVVVIGAYEGVVLADRVVRPDAARDESALPKLMEILTDEKTVFAKITSTGTMKIPWSEIAEGDIVWVYQHVRSLEETLAEPVPSELAIPLADALKNPRERIAAGYVVIVSGRK